MSCQVYFCAARIKHKENKKIKMVQTLWFNFIFGHVLFFFVLVYDYEIKENKNLPKDKLDHNIYSPVLSRD